MGNGIPLFITTGVSNSNLSKRFDRRRIDGRVIYLDIPSSRAWTTKVLLAACADKATAVFHNYVES